MVAFAERYKFLPEPDFPWPMFVAMARRLAEFGARELLDAIVGSIAGAAAGPFGSAEGRRRIEATVKELQAIARPGEDGETARRRGTPLNRD